MSSCEERSCHNPTETSCNHMVALLELLLCFQDYVLQKVQLSASHMMSSMRDRSKEDMLSTMRSEIIAQPLRLKHIAKRVLMCVKWPAEKWCIGFLSSTYIIHSWWKLTKKAKHQPTGIQFPFGCPLKISLVSTLPGETFSRL